MNIPINNWKVEHIPNRGNITPIYVSTEDGNKITHVGWVSNLPINGKTANPANVEEIAALIANAPDMLALLREACLLIYKMRETTGAVAPALEDWLHQAMCLTRFLRESGLHTGDIRQ